MRRTTIVTTLMFAFAYGAAFGAIQQMPRIVPGIEEVRALPVPQQQQTVSLVQAYQEFGGLAGRFLLAVLAIRIVSRRRLIRTFQIPGLIIIPFVFFYAGTHSLELTKWGMFAAGVFTVGQLNFWGNYLPRVYPTYLRGTGEGFFSASPATRPRKGTFQHLHFLSKILETINQDFVAKQVTSQRRAGTYYQH